jgi:hypothetical protein
MSELGDIAFDGTGLYRLGSDSRFLPSRRFVAATMRSAE